MHLIIIGSSGRLGSELVRHFSGRYVVTGIRRDQLDLSDSKSIRKALSALDYDRLIIAAALTGVDYCEAHEDEAFAVNADGPRQVCEISADKGAHVSYISSDFVFGGLSRRPYDEGRVARPLSVYGASKLEGEENVLDVSHHNLVVRVSWLYGGRVPAFPEWIINQALNHVGLSLPEEKISCPTYTRDFVNNFEQLLRLQEGKPLARGIFHLSNSGQCSWQEWGQFCLDVAAEAGLPLKTRWIGANCLEDIPAFVARRPINSVLSVDKFIEFTGCVPRQWQFPLREHIMRSFGGKGIGPSATCVPI
jgi:dTDP-4-dehydrorhamnose reductase